MADNRTTAIVKDRQTTLRSFLDNDKFKNQLREISGKFMTPEAMVRLVMVATSKTPKLLECTPQSIMRCLMDAAQLKIQPGGVMGRGYLVPRWNKKTGGNEACFDPGWRGLVDIARRSGQIQSISAHVVYHNDEFRCEYGTDESIKHVPCLDADPGPIIGAYAVAKFKDGSTQVEILSKRDLDKIQAVSQSKTGPWGDWEDEMSRKSAVRRLCKYLPFSDEMDRAIEASDRATGTADFTIDTQGEDVQEPVQEAKALAEPARTISLAEQLAAAKAQEETASRPISNSEPEEREPGSEG